MFEKFKSSLEEIIKQEEIVFLDTNIFDPKDSGEKDAIKTLFNISSLSETDEDTWRKEIEYGNFMRQILRENNNVYVTEKVREEINRKHRIATIEGGKFIGNCPGKWRRFEAGTIEPALAELLEETLCTYNFINELVNQSVFQIRDTIPIKNLVSILKSVNEKYKLVKNQKHLERSTNHGENEKDTDFYIAATALYASVSNKAKVGIISRDNDIGRLVAFIGAAISTSNNSSENFWSPLIEKGIRLYNSSNDIWSDKLIIRGRIQERILPAQYNGAYLSEDKTVTENIDKIISSFEKANSHT